jgi:hypothetical protein
MDLEKPIWRKPRQDGGRRSLNKKAERGTSRKGRAVSAQQAAQQAAQPPARVAGTHQKSRSDLIEQHINILLITFGPIAIGGSR